MGSAKHETQMLEQLGDFTTAPIGKVTVWIPNSHHWTRKVRGRCMVSQLLTLTPIVSMTGPTSRLQPDLTSPDQPWPADRCLVPRATPHWIQSTRFSQFVVLSLSIYTSHLLWHYHHSMSLQAVGKSGGGGGVLKHSGALSRRLATVKLLTSASIEDPHLPREWPCSLLTQFNCSL